jgi:nitrogen regulatory protein PII-like uncharacterized protein
MKQIIFEEAYNDILSVRVTTPVSTSLIYRGVKVENVEGNIRILNMNRGGDFYKEVTPEQYEVFFKKGFRKGVYEVCLDNYKRALDMLSIKIRNEVSKRNNVKHYEALKEYRNTIMNKISETIKLNETRQ